MVTRKITCDKCGKDITQVPSQQLYLGQSKYFDLCCSCYSQIKEEIASVVSAIKENDEVTACVDCPYYSDSQFYADNQIYGDIRIAGSCVRCRKNFAFSDPYNEIPDWCPNKEEKKWK